VLFRKRSTSDRAVAVTNDMERLYFGSTGTQTPRITLSFLNRYIKVQHRLKAVLLFSSALLSDGRVNNLWTPLGAGLLAPELDLNGTLENPRFLA